METAHLAVCFVDFEWLSSNSLMRLLSAIDTQCVFWVISSISQSSTHFSFSFLSLKGQNLAQNCGVKMLTSS